MARLYGGSGRIRMTETDIATNRAIAESRRRANAPKGAAGLQARITDMATVMLDRATANDNCTEKDLLVAGFSPREIVDLGPRATARARLMAPNLRIA